MRRKRFPNGYGGVTKLSGNRKNPYMAWVPQKKIKAGKVLTSYYKDVEEVSDFVNAKEFKNEQFKKDLMALIEEYSQPELEVTKKKVPIGYFPTYEDACNCLYERNVLQTSVDALSLTFANVWRMIEAETTKDVGEARKRAYRKAFDNCLPIHNKKMRTIKTREIQQIVDEVARTSPTQQQNVIALCNAVFKYAMSQDIVNKNYTEFAVIRPYETGDKVPFSKDEIKKIIDTDWRYKSRKSVTNGINISRVLTILIYTGTRITELLNVKKEDVHLKDRYIEVHGTKTDSADRIVPIHKDILALMKPDGDYLITDNSGKAISYRQIGAMFEACMKDLELTHTIHETRHTFISLATASDINHALLKKIVGHSDSTITGRYTHAFIEDLVKEIDKVKVL